MRNDAPDPDQRSNETLSRRPVNWGSRLYRDFLSGDAAVQSFFGPSFDDEPVLAVHASRLAAKSYPRDDLTQALGELADDYRAPIEAREQLEQLRRPDSLVVVAGQQTGLFTGAVLSIYKALTVERWAADLSSRLDLPVIPCFWLSSDDHDFEEVSSVRIPCGLDIRTLAYSPRCFQIGEPIDRLQVEPGFERLVAALGEVLPRTGFTEAVLRNIRNTYTVGTPFTTAFARLWYAMFPASKLLFVSPAHERLQRLAAPLLAEAIAGHARLFAAYDDTSRKLEALGYHRQVHKTADQTLLMCQTPQRVAVRRDRHGRILQGGDPGAAAEALREDILERPQDYSANVLLRPLIQNSLLPALGVVLGPAELAYHAQIGGLHDHFGLPRPAILPRTSVTIIEPFVARMLSHHGIDPAALMSNPDREAARVLQSLFPPDLESCFQRAARNVQSSFEDLAGGVRQFDPGMLGAVRAGATRAGREIDRVLQKARASHSRRQRDVAAQLRRLHMHLLPDHRLQERVFNITYYWAQYGPRFLRRLYESWPSGSRDHVFWKVP